MEGADTKPVGIVSKSCTLSQCASFSSADTQESARMAAAGAIMVSLLMATGTFYSVNYSFRVADGTLG